MWSRDLRLLLYFRILRSLAAGMITISFPYLLLAKLRYSEAAVGGIFAAATIATAILGAAVGHYTDALGRKKVLWIVGALLPASALLLWGSWSFPAVLLAAVLGGFSQTGSLAGGGVGGAAMPAQSAAIADLCRLKDRTPAFAIFTFTSGAFAALGMFLARFFAAKASFLVAGLLSLAGVAFLAPLRIPRPKEAPHPESRKVAERFSITGALNGLSQGLTTPFLIPFFIAVYHIPKSQMAFYGFAAGLLGSTALLAAPRLDRLWGFVGSIAVTRGLGTLLLLTLAFTPARPFAVLVYLLTPALRVAALPIQQKAITDMAGDEWRGRALGFNQAARLLSSSGGTALTGWLFEEGFFGLPFCLHAALMSANIYLYFRFFWRSELPGDGEPTSIGN